MSKQSGTTDSVYKVVELAHHYLKSGWLVRLGRGVFMFPNDTLRREKLSARESRAALCALGRGIEFAVGSRCRKGSGKPAGTKSLDRPPQRRDNARAEPVMDKAYVEVVRLLLESAPAIFETPHFAMKGGTAINLFIEDMPRLSVDIDVVFTDHETTRDNALKSISSALETARKRLAKAGVGAEVSSTNDGDEIKLFIRRGRNQVKVEVNHVFRGTVLPVETRRLSDEARKLFTTELSVPVLATPELYGSKLVAAMDHQHPRDLFDVRGLFERGGLTADVVECYLAGHNRPVHEVLFSRDQDMSMAFKNEFAGLTSKQILTNHSATSKVSSP